MKKAFVIALLAAIPFLPHRELTHAQSPALANGGFETGDLAGWTAWGVNGGFAMIVEEGTCFSANNTRGLTLSGTFAAIVRSSGSAPTNSIGILTSDTFVAGPALAFSALSENDDAVPAADPVTLELRLLDSTDAILVSQVIETNIVTLSPGSFVDVDCLLGQVHDGIFGTHFIDTSAFAGQAVRLEFRQHTNVPGKGFFTLIDDVEVVGAPQPPCSISGVPLFKQGASPWGGQQYDNSTKTIEQWGCMLTSAAMLINYYGASVGAATDPGQLNSCLNSLPPGRGYIGASVNPRGVEECARRFGLTDFYYKGRIGSRDDTALRSYLCDANPVIIGFELDNNPANGLDHFVVATGEATVNGTDTWLINDPAYSRDEVRDYPANDYQGIRLYSRSPGSPALIIGTYPTVPFLISDPEGRRVGYEADTGEILDEIPGAHYYAEHLIDDRDPDAEASPTQYLFELFHPPDGVYTVQLSSPYETSYTAYFVGYDDQDAASSVAASGTVVDGSPQTFLVDYSASHDQHLAVTLLVDIDIKPGSDTNPINCSDGSRVITVAVLTTESFDALSVDHATVTFEGADEAHIDKNSGEPRLHEEDVDGDGDIDLVFHFRLSDTSLTCAAAEGILTGETFGGAAVQGADALRMVDEGAPNR